MTLVLFAHQLTLTSRKPKPENRHARQDLGPAFTGMNTMGSD
jgi:hypothetical protein